MGLAPWGNQVHRIQSAKEQDPSTASASAEATAGVQGMLATPATPWIERVGAFMIRPLKNSIPPTSGHARAAARESFAGKALGNLRLR